MTTPKHFYHGSRRLFASGHILTPQLDGYSQRADEQGFEHLVTQMRPAGQLSRMRSVFLVDDPDLIDPCGGSTDAIYRVEPAGEVQQSDLAWYSEAWALYGDEGNTPRVREMVLHYWMGRPFHTASSSCMEYRAPAATVQSMVELNVDLAELEVAPRPYPEGAPSGLTP
ncbi:hypothetical protein [Geopseudomonas aromaticivorans]